MTSYRLEITRLGGLGDGSGMHEGAPVFVPKSCIGDELTVRDTESKAGVRRAEIIDIVTAGKDRAPAPCPHYAACGGCSLQHLSQSGYQQFKRDVVMSALSYGGFPDIVPEFHFLPANSRRRADFKVENGQLAYVAAKSHARVPISDCLILTPRLRALIAPLNELLPLLPEVTSVQMTEADSGIDLQIESPKPLPEMAIKMFADQHGLARANNYTANAVTMHFGGQKVSLPPDAFLQASKEAETLMTSLVVNAAAGANNIVEFFSGLGTYTFPLAKKATVSAFELDNAMVSAMLKLHHPRVKAFRRDLFKEPMPTHALKGFDIAVINPPRMGASAQTKALATSGIAKIVMVSCNHATWSRDAKALKDAGYKLNSLAVIDQFVYSPHVELVSIFTK